MANTGLYGPFDLTQSGIEKNVKGTGPGAYALGRFSDNTFYVDYVGRSDDDLAGRLQQHVPEPYPTFKYGFLDTPKAAFDKECNLYHDFSPPNNLIHPARPRGTNWRCPRCAVFD